MLLKIRVLKYFSRRPINAFDSLKDAIPSRALFSMNLFPIEESPNRPLSLSFVVAAVALVGMN